MTSKSTARMLRKLADSIEGMNDTELEKFVDEFSSLSTQALSRKSKASSKKRNPVAKKQSPKKLDNSYLKDTMEKISNSTTREIGANFLEQQKFTRVQLESLARIRSIHINKEDNVEQIKEKIIELTIGSRLRSDAIRRG